MIRADMLPRLVSTAGGQPDRAASEELQVVEMLTDKTDIIRIAGCLKGVLV